jgi:hypothetical protein
LRIVHASGIVLLYFSSVTSSGPGPPRTPVSSASIFAIASRVSAAQMLVHSLTSQAAERKTFELIAERGPEPSDLDLLLAAIDTDGPGAIDAAHDNANMPISAEPAPVRRDLDEIRTMRREDPANG